MTDEPNPPSEPSEPGEPGEPGEPSEPGEPLEWTLRVSVDGAQRLLHAWKDGRLEKTLGFPIASLLIHTPFMPTPGGGGSGPPDDDSRPITLLPWDGISVAGAVMVQASPAGPAGSKGGGSGGGSAARADAAAPKPAIEGVEPSAAPPQERGGSGAKKVAVAVGLVAAVLIALWLARSSPDEPTPETAPPEAIEPRAGDGRPSGAAADDSRASAPGAALEEPAAAAAPEGTGSATTTEGTDSADTVSDAAAPQTTEPAAVVPEAPAAPPDDGTTPRSGDDEAQPGPAEGLASDGKAGAAKPRKGGGGKPTSKEGAPKPPKKKALYSHYHCATEGAAFEIVLHARSEAEAKADACGGVAAEERAACIRTTTCKPTQ